MGVNSLQDRLIKMASDVILNINSIKKSYAGQILSQQLIRSVSSVSLNYAEARAAESDKDYVHKISICLKELRESSANLNLLTESKQLSIEIAKNILEEIDQLIAMLFKCRQKALKKINPVS